MTELEAFTTPGIRPRWTLRFECADGSVLFLFLWPWRAAPKRIGKRARTPNPIFHPP